MKKILTAAAAVATITTASAALPTPASAYPVWVIPAIIGGTAAGLGVGAAAANANNAYNAGLEARGQIYVEPTCHVVYERTPYGLRRARVCD